MKYSYSGNKGHMQIGWWMVIGIHNSFMQQRLSESGDKESAMHTTNFKRCTDNG